MTIRLLIVDDDPLVRAGLTLMLGGAEELAIVGEGADGREVPELVARLHPDVVLMDIRMPQVDGLTATERLRAEPGAPEVVVLTTFHADEQVLRALRAGCRRVRPQGHPAGRDRRGRTPGRGRGPGALPGRHPSAHDPCRRAAGTAPRTAAAGRLSELADREREVAVAVGRGLSNAEIAAALYMSVPTVKTHVSRVLAKLGLNNRVQIALLVHDAGLLEEDDQN